MIMPEITTLILDAQTDGFLAVSLIFLAVLCNKSLDNSNI